MLKSFSIYGSSLLEKSHWWERKGEKNQLISPCINALSSSLMRSCASRMKGPRSLCRKKPWLCNTYCVIIKERRLCVTMTQNFDTHYTFREPNEESLAAPSPVASAWVIMCIRIWNVIKFVCAILSTYMLNIILYILLQYSTWLIQYCWR